MTKEGFLKHYILHVLDKNAVNEHIEFPVSYLPLLESVESNGIRHKMT